MLTSSAATGEAFVTVTVQVMVPPSTTVAGSAVFATLRSTWALGGGGGGIGGGGGGGMGGWGGSGGSGGSGVGGFVMRRFVNVQTTKSPFATAPSAFVPLTES